MSMRKAIATHPLLQKYFKILTVGDMIPAEYRESGIESYWDPGARLVGHLGGLVQGRVRPRCDAGHACGGRCRL